MAYKDEEKEKAYHKAYYSRPEVKKRRKEYMKAYRPRPEVKKRDKERMKAYRSRPEVKAEHARRERNKFRIKSALKRLSKLPKTNQSADVGMAGFGLIGFAKF